MIDQDLISGMEKGYAAEIGAADGKLLSTTLDLEEKGWTVLCVEPNPLYYEALAKSRHLVLPVACDLENQDFVPFTMFQDRYNHWLAGSALNPRWDAFGDYRVRMPEIVGQLVVPVAVRTLDWCLEWAGFPRLDVLSVDTEGNDLRVFQSMDMERWQPKIILTENWMDESAPRVYLESKGYRRLWRRDVNDLYVRQDAGLPLRHEAVDPVPAEQREVHRAGQ